VGLAVDHEAAHAADAFAAIVVEGDGVLALVDEGFVEDVEHFEEGHVLVDVGCVIADHAAGVFGIFLAPNVKSEFHVSWGSGRAGMKRREEGRSERVKEFKSVRVEPKSTVRSNCATRETQDPGNKPNLGHPAPGVASWRP